MHLENTCTPLWVILFICMVLQHHSKDFLEVPYWASRLEVVGKVLHCFALVKYSIILFSLYALKLIFDN
jgi:hypothetical protein